MGTKDSTKVLGHRLRFARLVDDITVFEPPEITSRMAVLRTRTGVSNPGWKRQVDAGENATTPLSARYETFESWPQKDYVVLVAREPPESPTPNARYLMYPNRSLSGYDMTGQLTDSDSSEADNRARAKFFKKLREEQVRFSGPTFLGELAETLHMIRRPATALRDGIRDYVGALRKRKRADPRNWLRAASGTWLEYSFGWTPLLHDVQDAYSAYESLVTKTRTAKISAGGVQERELHQGPYADTLSGVPYCSYFLKYQVVLYKNTVRYKGALRARAEGATISDKLAVFGFTPSEFVPTAWELLPWSFLVDYFTNIGDILTSVVTDTSRLAWVNKTEIRESTFVQNRVLDVARIKSSMAPNTYVYSDSQTGEAIFKRRDITRSVGTGIAIPNLAFDLPGSNKQLLNMAALLGQVNVLHPQRFRDPRLRRPKT
jgi:hypothetical protein